MKIAFFDTRSYDKASFTKANKDGGFNYEIDFRDYKLNENTAMTAAAAAGIKVVRVPAYSPYAVAEHGAALLCNLS